jgi:hypothetical protein
MALEEPCYVLDVKKIDDLMSIKCTEKVSFNLRLREKVNYFVPASFRIRQLADQPTHIRQLADRSCTAPRAESFCHNFCKKSKNMRQNAYRFQLRCWLETYPCNPFNP